MNKSLFSSLVFPILNVIVSLLLLTLSQNSKLQTWFVLILTTSFITGFLSILLIVLFKIDTSKYIANQIITLIISFAICFLSILSLSLLLIFVMPILFLIAQNIYFGLKTKNFKEWVVLFLCNPLMHYLIIGIGGLYNFAKSDNFMKLGF